MLMPFMLMSYADRRCVAMPAAMPADAAAAMLPPPQSQYAIFALFVMQRRCDAGVRRGVPPPR